MISLEEFKAALGDYGLKFSDEELEELCSDMYGVANIAFDIWLKENNKIVLPKPSPEVYNQE
jgi:hypothetical protein